MSSTFDHNKFSKLVPTVVVTHKLSSQFFEFEFINAIFKCWKFDIQLISRNTLKVDVLKNCKAKKNILKSIL